MTFRDIELPCSHLGLPPLILCLACCHPFGLLLLTLLLVSHPLPLPWILTRPSPSTAPRKTCHSGKLFQLLTFPNCTTQFGLLRQLRLQPLLLSLTLRSLRIFCGLKNTNLYPKQLCSEAFPPQLHFLVGFLFARCIQGGVQEYLKVLQ